MTIPDTHVTFSAAGVAEVVAAFNKVAAAAQASGKAAQASGKASAQGLGLLDKALGELKTLLPAIGIGAAVAGLERLVVNAIESADAMEKLSQKTGVAVATLSGLYGAAILSDIATEDLDRGLKKLAVSIQEAHAGTGKAADAFKAMGISVDDAHGKTKPMDALLLEIADKFRGYKDGADKAALASDLFGARFGQTLIPFLNRGSDGIEELRQRAEALGYTLTENDVSAADKAVTAFHELKLATEGLGHALGTASAGPLTLFEQWLTRVIAKMNQQKTLMGKIGVLALAQVDAVLPAKQSDVDEAKFRANFAAEHAGWATPAGTAAAPKLSDAKGADELSKAKIAALKAGAVDELALYKSQDELLAAQQKRAYDAGLLSVADYFAARQDAITKGSAKEIDALVRERDALMKAPVATVNKTKDQVAAERTVRDAEVATLNNRIQIAQNTAEEAHQATTDEQGKEDTSLAEKRLDVERRIQAAQGDTYGAAIDAIKKQAIELARLKVPKELIDQITALDTAAAHMKDLESKGSLAMGGLSDVHAGLQTGVAAGDLFPFQALERYDAAVQAALPHLRDLAAQERAAAMTPEDRQKAQQFTDTIEQMGATSSETSRQLATIKSGIESGLQGAFTNFFTTGIEQAHSFGDAMRTLALDVVKSMQQIVANILATQATKALLGLFPGSDAGGQGSGASTAAKQVATAAATGVAQAAPLMVAATEMTAAGAAVTAAGGSLVAGATMALAAATALDVSAAALMAAAAAQAAASGAATAAAVVGAVATVAAVAMVAEGGLISGPGTGTSDSIPARLSAGEYVTPARVVAAPGNLEMLRQMHRGMQPFVFRSPGSYSRESWARGYAEGGLVGAPSGAALSALEGAGASSGGGNGAHVVVSLSEGLVADHIESGPGSRAVIRAIGDNRNAVKAALGVK